MKLSIVEYIERRWGVRFVQRGAATMAVCPFHSHPSTNLNLRVWPERNTYVCSCDQEGGTLWDLIRKHEGLPGPGEPGFEEQTLPHICEVMGLPLPRKVSSTPRGIVRRVYGTLRQLLRPLDDSAERLLEGSGHHRKGSRPLEWHYRGVDAYMWLSYDCGHLPEPQLARFLEEVSERELSVAGINPWKGIGYRYLCEGVLLIRRDHEGYPCGFALRRYSGSGPKYIKSGNNPAVRHGGYLFGLYRVRPGQTVYVTEGEFDALALELRGLGPAVAMGFGKLTKEQYRALRERASRIVMVVDGDPNGAGLRNALSMAETWPDLEFIIFRPTRTGKLDVDEFLQTRSVEEFLRLPVLSARQLRMRMERRDDRGRWKDARALASRYLEEMIAHPTLRLDDELKDLSRLSGIPEETLRVYVVRRYNQHIAEALTERSELAPASILSTGGRRVGPA